MFLRKKNQEMIDRLRESYQYTIDRLKFENRELLKAHGVDLHERKRLGDEVARLEIKNAELKKRIDELVRNVADKEVMTSDKERP